MPWQERSAMEEREAFVAEYQTGLWTMTELSAVYGISRKTGHTWIARYAEGGRTALADQSRRPHAHPDTIPDRIVQRVVAARRRFPRWSAGKLVQWLETHYPRTEWPGRTTAYALLARAELPRAPRRPGPKRVRSPRQGSELTVPLAANQVWTTDFKGEFRLGNGTYCHPLTVRDGFSRCVLRCDALAAESYPYTRAMFDRAFARFGLPECIRSDNGRPFATTGLAGLSRLNVYWIRLGIRVERITPGCPEQNGSHEQFHRILKRDTTRPPAVTLGAQQRRFDAFCREYNEQRPHDALAGGVPATLYTRSHRPWSRALPTVDYPAHWEVRGADSTGVITFRGRPLNVTRALADQDIALEEIDDAIWRLWFVNTPLGHFDARRWSWIRPDRLD